MVWTGDGWIGGVIAAAALALPPLFLERLAPGTAFAQPVFGIALGAAIASLACWKLGRSLNRDLPVRVLGLPEQVHDPETGEPVHEELFGILVPVKMTLGHTVYYLRVEFSGIVIGGIVLAAAVARHLGAFAA